MPSRNIIKDYVQDAYYHVYNRGVEKRDIFLDDHDFIVFTGLLKKYLQGAERSKTNRHLPKNYVGQIDLLAYCLMPNHFHLLFYQKNQQALSGFMRSLMTGYAMYFNNRHNRIGPLFQGRFRASQILDDAYLDHISRYIHLNPDNYDNYPYSSWQYYSGRKHADWLKAGRIMTLFNDNFSDYKDFIDDYVDSKKENDFLRWQLANDPEEF